MRRIPRIASKRRSMLSVPELEVEVVVSQGPSLLVDDKLGRF